jgi:rhamnosyltransferase
MRKVSVLIPTYNAEPYIEELLKSLFNQTLKNDVKIEVIIVDSSSSDNTVKILKEKFPQVILEIIPNKSFNHGGTRNLLASKASGEYLLFMTQDAIPYDCNLIMSLLNPFETDENIAVSYARQIPKEDANVLETFVRNFNYPPESCIKEKSSLNSLGIKTFFNSNVCSMYRRDLFEKFGKFPENIILNEDMIFASKVILNGYKVYYAADAKVYHSHNYNLSQQFKRYFDIGMAFDEIRYLLKYASNEKEGLRLVINQMNFLIKNKKIHLVPYAFVETCCKFLGYQIGKRHKLLPKNLKRKLSAYMK